MAYRSNPILTSGASRTTRLLLRGGQDGELRAFDGLVLGNEIITMLRQRIGVFQAESVAHVVLVKRGINDR